LVAKVQQDDSNSGISSAASVGNSPSSVSSSHLRDLPCNSFGQMALVHVNQRAMPSSSSNLFSLQHMDTSRNLVQSQPAQLLQQLDISSLLPSFGHFSDKSTPNLLSMQSQKSAWPYVVTQIIN
jgi:hypothetical protein